MNSFLTKFLYSNATKLSEFLNRKIPILKPYHIITCSLILHACALMNLLNNRYPVFILLFFTGYFCTILDQVYAKEFDYNSKKNKYYHNVAQWVIIISLYTIFSGLYKYKIGIPIIILVIIILILCNLNFVLSSYNEENKCIEIWSKCIKKIMNKDGVHYIQNFTKYFDDSMIIVYLIIIMTYLYYKN